MDNYSELLERLKFLEEENRRLIYHASKLIRWLPCMSYNDSYFGEPEGLVKMVTSELQTVISWGVHEKG